MAFGSRDVMELVASAVNVNAANYPNDATLEQKLLYELKVMTAKAGTGTTTQPSNTAVARVSGDKNV